MSLFSPSSSSSCAAGMAVRVQYISTLQHETALNSRRSVPKLNTLLLASPSCRSNCGISLYSGIHLRHGNTIAVSASNNSDSAMVDEDKTITPNSVEDNDYDGGDDDDVGIANVQRSSLSSLELGDSLEAGQLHQRTWLQEQFVSLVLPVVRVLSGADFNNRPQIDNDDDDDDSNAFVETVEEEKVSWSLWKLLTGTLPSGYYRRKISRRLRQAETDFFIFTSHLGKFLLVMMSTGAILATGYELAGGDSQLETVLWCSWLAGIIVGSMIGAEKVLEKRFRSGPRNVVITGSTRGLGKALAREFLLAGDRVVIASRSPASVALTVKELEAEAASRLYHLFPMETSGMEVVRNGKRGPKVVGIACDVSNVDDVRALANFATEELGSVDIWINNAGVNKGFRPLLQFSDDDIRQIVSANMIGSLLCTREAMRVMKAQPKGGHIFNMDGAGSGGSSTPLTAVYGATKCGLRQLHLSLLKECKRSRIGIHTASPGMVLTDLLLSGASLQNKKMFNIICELPETVARTLVPRMREIKGTGKAVNYLTPPRILLALITAWLRRGRWFDEEGRAVYEAEADRLRNWAEGRTRLPFSAAVDQFSDATMVSVFSITVVCAFIMLSSVDSGMPGT